MHAYLFIEDLRTFFRNLLHRCLRNPNLHRLGDRLRRFLDVYNLNKPRRQRSRKTEIANFDGATACHEYVGGLNVAVHDVCRMYKVHTTQNVVQYGYDVLLSKILKRLRGQDIS